MEAALLSVSFGLLTRERRGIKGQDKIQKKGKGHFVDLTKYFGPSFSFNSKKPHRSYFVARLKNKETDDWNEWLCVRVVNPVDGYMVSLLFTEKKKHLREEKKKSPSHTTTTFCV